MTNQGHHAAGCDVVMPEPDRDTPERRDWANLPPELAVEIAGCLLGIDLTEYVRFRAVCKPWRRSTDDPHGGGGGLDSRFFPRNWVMLSNNGAFDAPRRLLNVATGACIADEFPEFSGHYPLGYADGLIVLGNTETCRIRLLNPLTHAIVTDLPPFSSFNPNSVFALLSPDGTGLFYRGFGVVDGGGAAAAPVASPPTMVLFLARSDVPVLAVIRPGEPDWALVDTSELSCEADQVSVLSQRGRFYLSTATGDVLTVELHPAPRLVRVVSNDGAATVPAAFPSFYLAPSGTGNGGAGMLMIVTHATGDDLFADHVEQVEVLEVDVDGRRLVPRSTVGGDRALFLGKVRALPISTELFPSIAASAGVVYLCHGQGYRGVLFRAFHVDNGRSEPAVELELSEMMQAREPPFGPFNLDIFLAACVDALAFC